MFLVFLKTSGAYEKHSGMPEDKAFVWSQMAISLCLHVCHFPGSPSNSAVTWGDQWEFIISITMSSTHTCQSYTHRKESTYAYIHKHAHEHIDVHSHTHKCTHTQAYSVTLGRAVTSAKVFLQREWGSVIDLNKLSHCAITPLRVTYTSHQKTKNTFYHWRKGQLSVQALLSLDWWCWLNRETNLSGSYQIWKAN